MKDKNKRSTLTVIFVIVKLISPFLIFACLASAKEGFGETQTIFLLSCIGIWIASLLISSFPGHLKQIFLFYIIFIISVFIGDQIYRSYLRQEKENVEELAKNLVINYVSDEVLLSDENNPIGIRIKLNVLSPNDGEFSISPELRDLSIAPATTAGYSLSNYSRTIIPDLYLFKSVVNPPHLKQDESSYVPFNFKANKSYQVELDFLPFFLLDCADLGKDNHIKKEDGYYYKCIDKTLRDFYDTEAAIREWIEDKGRFVNYEVMIEARIFASHAQGEMKRNFHTGRTYNIKDFYNSAVREGGYLKLRK